jgi:hypothetical protein
METAVKQKEKSMKSRSLLLPVALGFHTGDPVASACLFYSMPTVPMFSVPFVRI